MNQCNFCNKIVKSSTGLKLHLRTCKQKATTHARDYKIMEIGRKSVSTEATGEETDASCSVEVITLRTTVNQTVVMTNNMYLKRSCFLCERYK